MLQKLNALSMTTKEVAAQKVEGQWKGDSVSEAQANDAHNVAEAKKTEIYGATPEETSKKSVATQSTGSEMQSDSNT